MSNNLEVNLLEIEDEILSSEDEESSEEIKHDYVGGETKLDMCLDT